MSKILWILFISMLPIVELRGAIPVGAALGLPMWLTFILAVVGNLLPVPFILIFIKKALHFMQNCKIELFRKVADFVILKGEKNKDAVTKYATFGLLVFVAIPLPGTGAWTGALVAALLNMKFKNALISVVGGVLVAGVIVTAVSYGFLGFLSWLV